MSETSTTYDRVLAGHLGFLTEEQQERFAAFKDNLASARLYQPPSPPSVQPSHDDATLLRFLRARRFEPDKAQRQFTTTEDWRRQQDIGRLYATFPADEFERAKRFYPRWTGRRDKHGVPVYVFRLASLTGPMQKELNAVPVERRYQRIVALWEFMSRFTLPLCTALPHPHDDKTPISTVTSIIDLESVSLGTMWSLRHHLQQASELATAHYPETLHRIAVVNAPAFFPTVWGWIKAWFDEGTRTKVMVLGRNPGEQLRTFIEPHNLPKAYGGELEFAFEDEPVLDEPAREALGGEMPKGPIVFVDGKAVRPAVPEEEPKPSQEKRTSKDTNRSQGDKK
ncbi:CRAL/TRIO domain-containing protein [Dentipellis sp. KUC8613]|nr:CRAL/TRIO domain-containing protein [Dentipellis sp. KUC8613]